MKHLLYTLLLGVFLTSCYRKIDLDEYRTTPKYNPQIQISAESETKRSIFREKDKTKRSKRKARNTQKAETKVL